MARPPGHISVKEFAELTALSVKDAREYAKDLHSKHRDVLQRRQGRSTRLWINENRAAEIVAKLQIKTGGRELLAMSKRLDELQLLAERNSLRLTKLEKKQKA